MRGGVERNLVALTKIIKKENGNKNKVQYIFFR